jgi:hypothetical protein
MIRNIENTVLARPDTLAGVYFLAYNYKTTITRTADAYFSDYEEKRSTAKAGRGQQRYSPRTESKSEKRRKKPSAKSEKYINHFDAKKLGYEKGTCAFLRYRIADHILHESSSHGHP